MVHAGVRDPHALHPDPELGREVLERELLGARAVAHDQRRRRQANASPGLEVRADAVAADVRRARSRGRRTTAAAVAVSIRRSA